MTDTYEALIGIPSSHRLRLVSTKVEQRRGQDSDVYLLEELEGSVVVARYEVRDSMSIYPPFKKTVTWKKING